MIAMLPIIKLPEAENDNDEYRLSSLALRGNTRPYQFPAFFTVGNVFLSEGDLQGGVMDAHASVWRHLAAAVFTSEQNFPGKEWA